MRHRAAVRAAVTTVQSSLSPRSLTHDDADNGDHGNKKTGWVRMRLPVLYMQYRYVIMSLACSALVFALMQHTMGVNFVNLLGRYEHVYFSHRHGINGDRNCYFEWGEDTFKYKPKKEHESSPEHRGVGVCRYAYPQRSPPAGGWVAGIDFVFHRDEIAVREQCYLNCVALLEPSAIDQTMLIEAAAANLPRVAKRLMEIRPDLNPRWAPVPDVGLNAIQVAIHGGFAEVVNVLTKGNHQLVIDRYHRTVEDYVTMNGSPIRPVQAKRVLGITVPKDNGPNDKQRPPYRPEIAYGWNQETRYAYDMDRCDFEVVYGELSRADFVKKFLIPGRPFVLRGHSPQREMEMFSKDRMDTTRHFKSTDEFSVGPTSYPPNTGQPYCKADQTLVDLSHAKQCKEMPDKPMIHAFHPDESDFEELYPLYRGNVLNRHGTFRDIESWFGPARHDPLSWQVFFGGDESGAAYHYHNAALNALYVGVKEWKIVPPIYKGWTGLTVRKSGEMLPPDYTLQCTQLPGDLAYIPHEWGHMTSNHGFTIGAAVIFNRAYHQGYELRRRDHFMRMEYGDIIKADALKKADELAAVEPPEEEESESEDEESESEDEEEDDEEGDDGELSRPTFLFVHVNKAGGTSMTSMLESRCGDEYYHEHWGEDPTHRSFHATAMSYIDHLGRKVFDDAYTFAVVRHPLARQVSDFFFLANNCSQGKDLDKCAKRKVPIKLRGVDINQLPEEEKIRAFHQWIENLYNTYPPGHPENYLFGSSGHGNEESKSFNATQTSWVVDDHDNIVVSSVFRLENLRDDMSELEDAIPCLRSRDRSLGSKMEQYNVSPPHPDWTAFTKNKMTVAIIKEVYAADFKNFGYTL